jgi:hypothetical protein
MRAMLISVQQANSLQHEVEKITPVNLQRLTAQVGAEECQKGKIHYDRMPVGLVPKRFHESPHLSIYVAMLQSKLSKLELRTKLASFKHGWVGETRRD